MSDKIQQEHQRLSKLSFLFTVGKYSPSARWGHIMCMINEKEAIIIGGQGDKQTFCKDSSWLLDMSKQVSQTNCLGAVHHFHHLRL